MITKMYSIYDVKTNIYMPPMYYHNAGHAMRNVSDQCKSNATTVSNHPEDFRLFELGEFNDETAEINIHQTPILTCEMSDLLHQDKETPI